MKLFLAMTFAAAAALSAKSLADLQPVGDPVIPGSSDPLSGFDVGTFAAPQPVCTTTPVGITLLGDAGGTSSWGQRFVFEDRAGESIDLLAVYLQSGSRFAAPTLRAFDSPARDVQLDVTDVAAAGTLSQPVRQLDLEVWFDGTPADPVSFIFGAWQPGEQETCEAYELSWTQVGGSYCWVTAPVPTGDLPRPIDDPPAVPVLPAALLGGSGIATVSLVSILRGAFRSRR